MQNLKRNSLIFKVRQILDVEDVYRGEADLLTKQINVEITDA